MTPQLPPHRVQLALHKVPRARAVRRLTAVVLAALVLAALLPAAPLYAQEGSPAPAATATALVAPWVLPDANGSRVGWDAGGALAAAAGAQGVAPAGLSVDAVAGMLGEGFPRQRYQGYDLPLQTMTLQLPLGVPAALEVRGVIAVDLAPGTLTPGAPALPTVIVDEGQPEPEAKETVALPTAPIFILRSGRLGDVQIVVLALSPYYTENGGLKLATAVDAWVPGAQPLAGPAWDLVAKPEPNPIFAAAVEAATAAADDPARAVEAAALGASVQDAVAALAIPAAIDGTTFNPAALDQSDTTVRIVVSQPGMQSVPRAALAALVPAYQGAAFNTLKVTRKGVEVPVQLVGADELRFYVAGPLGDRWNSTDVHLITINAADPSPLMAQRTVAGMTSGAASFVLEPGFWVKNNPFSYATAPNWPGADGDRYFAGEASYYPAGSTAEGVEKRSSVTVDLAVEGGLKWGSSLPLAAGTVSTYTLTLGAKRANSGASPKYELQVAWTEAGVAKLQNLDVTIPEGPAPTYSWPDAVQVSFALPTAVTSFTLSHRPGSLASAALLDSVSLLRTARLELGGKGARFQAPAGVAALRWVGAPSAQLYDVTDGAAPVVLSGANGNGFTDSVAQRRYLVAGTGTLLQPALQKPTAFAFNGLTPSDALYIIPSAEYLAPLQQLLTLRQGQGYRTSVINVNALYDSYSFGWVDPYAIRRFLQQAWSVPAWQDKLLSTVLVGDGTVDIKGFEGKTRSFQLIPPFMADDADPWLDEVACDPCFGQLNDPDPALGLGENPHLGDVQNPLDPNTKQDLFVPEVWIGRFPVNSVEELTALITKIVNYEKAPAASNPSPLPGWRGRILYVTDNVWKPLNPGVAGTDIVQDKAGNFEYVSNHLRALNPSVTADAVMSEYWSPRIYYAPYPEKPVGTEIGSWRVQDPDQIPNRLESEVSKGVSVLIYNGHANHYYMGNVENGPAVREAVLQIQDPESLFTNQLQPFVMLAMTCEAAQFIKPTNSGRVATEAFILDPDGSAVAVWGPTGQSDAHSHDMLQAGFFSRLYSENNKSIRIGELTDAGYIAVSVAQSQTYVLRTFVLFGDPLTRLKPQYNRDVMMPIVAR